jgi:DNA topoisomerase-1
MKGGWKKENGEEGVIIGQCPETGNNIILLNGIYGKYIKLDGTNKIAPIKDKDIDVDINLAIELLKYPYDLGKYDKKKIIIKKGKYGEYAEWNGQKIGLKGECTLDNVIELIKQKTSSSKQFIDKKTTYTILTGQYGPYVSVVKGKIKKNVPLKSIDINNITIEQLKEIIETNKGKKKKVYNNNNISTQ